MTDNAESANVSNEEEIPAYTHKATMTVYSNGQDEDIAIKVSWDPDLDGKSIEEIGYLPSSYQFIQQYILPAIEQAYLDYEINPMLNAEPASGSIN